MLFGISMASGEYIEATLKIPVVVAVAAAANSIIAILALWLGKNNHTMVWSGASYVSLAALVGILLHATGNAASPYIALWMLVAVFTGLFGWLGVTSLALIANGYIASLALLSYVASFDSRFWMFVLAINLPILVGYMLWRKPSAPTGKPEQEDVGDPLKQLNKTTVQSEIVINSIADGVMAMDAQGTIQLINPAAQNLLGWSAGDAKGLHYESVIKLVDKRDQPIDASRNPLEEVRTTKKPIVNNDLTLVSKSEKKMLVSLVVSPVLEDKQVGTVIVVFRDITAEKAHEREQAEFVSTASHEMRTPVAAIEGYLALVANPKTANIDDKARMYLTKAQESVQHLGRLFQDLLTVSRAEDGRLEDHPQITDIVSFVGNIAESLQPKAESKDLELQFQPRTTASQSGDFHSKVTPIYYANVDRDHLREVTANLVENAIKYTKQGKIVVDVTGDDRNIRISIQDSGIGIPKEDIPHLFQKFYRVDNSDTREVGGTGLGLSIVRKLVETMRGKVWVESELGKGSTFYVSLPRVSNTEIKQLQQSEAIEALQQKKADAVPTPELAGGAATPKPEVTQNQQPPPSMTAIDGVKPSSPQPQPTEPEANPTPSADSTPANAASPEPEPAPAVKPEQPVAAPPAANNDVIPPKQSSDNYSRGTLNIPNRQG